MMEMKMYFSDLTDNRDNRGLRHDLGNIIVMSIYAVLCGYTDAENMAFFMKLQEPYFEKMLDLKYGKNVGSDPNVVPILAPTPCSEQVAPCADVIDYQYKVVDGVLYKRLYNYTLNKPLSDWVIAT